MKLWVFMATVLLLSCSTSALVVSEVYYDTPGDDDVEEWVELYNDGGSAVDLVNYTLNDNNRHYTFPSGVVLPASWYLVVARNASGFSALFGFDPDLSGMKLSLGNSGDEVTLKDASGNVLDYVAWEGYASGWSIYADTGKSIQRSQSGWVSNAQPTPKTGYDVVEPSTTTTESTSTTILEETTTTQPDDIESSTTTLPDGSSTTTIPALSTSTTLEQTASTSSTTTVKTTSTTSKMTSTTTKTTSTTHKTTTTLKKAQPAGSDYTIIKAASTTLIKVTTTMQKQQAPAGQSQSTQTTIKTQGPATTLKIKSTTLKEDETTAEKLPEDPHKTAAPTGDKVLLVQPSQETYPPTGYAVSIIVLGASAMVSTVSLVAVLLFLLTGRIKFH